VLHTIFWTRAGNYDLAGFEAQARCLPWSSAGSSITLPTESCCDWFEALSKTLEPFATLKSVARLSTVSIPLQRPAQQKRTAASGSATGSRRESSIPR
jgi:hypothetical protein